MRVDKEWGGGEAAFATYLGSEDGGSSTHMLGSEAGRGRKRAGMKNPWSVVGKAQEVEMLNSGVGDSREKVIVRGAASARPRAMTHFDKISTVTDCREARGPVRNDAAPIMVLELHIGAGVCCRDFERECYDYRLQF
jgi:hypothetical protein